MKIKTLFDETHEVMSYYIGFVLITSAVLSYFEGWSYFKSLYFMLVTSTTVGYGDITPETIIGKIIAIVTAHIVVFFLAPLIVATIIKKFE
jgi:voltage-gated potassium channel